MSTKKLVKQAIAKLDDNIKQLENSPHTQIKISVIQMKAEKEVLEAVLSSLNGDNVLLKLYT